MDGQLQTTDRAEFNLSQNVTATIGPAKLDINGYFVFLGFVAVFVIKVLIICVCTQAYKNLKCCPFVDKLWSQKKFHKIIEDFQNSRNIKIKKIEHNEPTWDTIDKLVKETWKYKDQAGRDALHLYHNSLKIRNIYAVENKKLLKKYSRVLTQTVSSGETVELMDNLPNTLKGQLPEKTPVKLEIISEINESKLTSGIGKEEDSTLESNLDGSLKVQGNVVTSTPQGTVQTQEYNSSKSQTRSTSTILSPGVIWDPKSLPQNSSAKFQHLIKSQESDKSKAQSTSNANEVEDIFDQKSLEIPEEWNPTFELKELSGSSETADSDSGIASLHGTDIPEVTSPLSTSSADEIFLFHGTRIKNLKGLIENGFALECASEKSLFGKGIYFTDSSQKADQYTDSRYNRRKDYLVMVIARVVLGNIALFEHKTEETDTVIAGTCKRFREYLKYKTEQCYPEFLVVYDRSFDEIEVV